ncbi:MAG TPA: phytoene/squalene synthase family protein [Tepiditoga sp.]|nr:phytoene/squalene synthase family protein [Tepiditoga sp.]
MNTDFKYCENLIKKESKSFYTAFSALPEKKAYAVFSVYAFCRTADNITDNEKSAEKLLILEKDLENFKNGIIKETPVFRTLKWVFDNFGLSIKPFLGMINGQKSDIFFKQPETQENLEDYCYNVAGTVGLMLNPILAEKNYPKLEDAAVYLGKAMQLTNILRDLGEDYDNGRIYIPKDVMKKFNYNEKDFNLKISDDRFIKLFEYEAQKADFFYEKFFEYFDLYDEDSKIHLKASAVIYREILNKIRKNNYNSMKKRNYLSLSEKLKILNTIKGG